MKIKLLLVAIVALVVSQSMEALQVTLKNSNPKGSSVDIWLTAKEMNNPKKAADYMKELTFGQNHTFDLSDKSIDNCSITIGDATYVVTSSGLTAKEIPLSGNHKIGIVIGGVSLGRLLLNIAVDNNTPVELYARTR